MARKPRVEFAGAVYHVINRGHSGRQIFAQPGPASLFERLLFEAAERSGWRIAAYCLMGDHYHLALTTPHGNLAHGMQWLQSTFATGFRHRFGYPGEVFQARYRATFVEPGVPLARLVNYIHLNPVRAGLRSPYNLESYRWSSFPKYIRAEERPGALHSGEWLPHLGEISDTPSGWEDYREHLAGVMALDSEARETIFGEIRRGWAIGGRPYRERLRAKLRQIAAGGEGDGEGLRRRNEWEWEKLTARFLARLGKTEEEVTGDRKTAEWKAAIAFFLKRRTSVSNPWLSRRLHMGPPAMVSRLASTFGRRPGEVRDRYQQRLGE